MLARQVWSAAATHHRHDVLPECSRRLQCGRCPGAGTKVTDRYALSGCVLLDPACGDQQAVRQQGNIKPRLVVQVLGQGEQIEQERAHAFFMEHTRYKIVAWTVPTAAAAMGKQNDAARVDGQFEHAFQVDAVHRQTDELCGGELHGFPD